MHVSSKDSSPSGSLHTLTSVIEADGPFELVKAGQIVTITAARAVRTPSGGIEVVTEINVSDPKPHEFMLPPPMTLVNTIDYDVPSLPSLP